MDHFTRDDIASVRRGETNSLYLGQYWAETVDAREIGIPTEVFELVNLEHLIIGQGGLKSLPVAIGRLPKLKRLDVRGNPLESLPNVRGLILDSDVFARLRDNLTPDNIIGIHVPLKADPPALGDLTMLPSLRELTIGLSGAIRVGEAPVAAGKALQSFISSLHDLVLLEKCDIIGVRLSTIPTSLRQLLGLRILCIAQADLRVLPDWLTDLTHLRRLGLWDNRLDQIPEGISSLPLDSLDISFNHITDLPDSLWGHSSLRALQVQNNRLTTVSAAVVDARRLTYLGIRNNPIEVPPSEVVRRGLDSIRDYWRQRLEVGVDYLCEAKLLVIGEGGAGKTTLIHKLLDPRYKLKKSEASTEGIEVCHWAFPTTLAVQSGEEERSVRRRFSVNLWDFGGQEVYHATHQFFLTRRSLYVLVADDRKEDTDFNYWLQVVELLSDASPLLIVQNEKQDRRRDLDLSRLRSRFPNFRECYRTNLATNRGLADIKKAMRQELQRLPHIGTPLPRTWKKVRRALETDGGCPARC